MSTRERLEGQKGGNAVVKELADKVAVVTGGAAGIGQGIVERFAAEGARIVIADLDTERGEALAAGYGEDVVFSRVDVADQDQVARLVTDAVDKFGGLDVMVNNAGIPSAMHRSLLDDDLADFHRVMSVNLLGVMVGTREAARYMAGNGGGSIVNVSSIGGIQAGPGVMSYRASKAAVIHFTKSAALDLADHDIRVNCVAPGHIPTGLLTSSMAGTTEREIRERVAATRATMRGMRPLRREGTPHDVAEAVLYFGSERSAYTTGTVLPLDGGTVAGMVRRT